MAASEALQLLTPGQTGASFQHPSPALHGHGRNRAPAELLILPGPAGVACCWVTLNIQLSLGLL